MGVLPRVVVDLIWGAVIVYGIAGTLMIVLAMGAEFLAIARGAAAKLGNR